jgi:AraC-like DNA-binding protein
MMENRRATCRTDFVERLDATSRVPVARFWCLTETRRTDAKMEFAYTQRPTPALRPFIERFAVMEFNTPLHDSHLPHTGPVAAFSFQGECVIDETLIAPSAAFTGLHEFLRRHEHRGNHAVILATFTSAGASAFSRVPLREVSSGTTHLENLVGESPVLTSLNLRLQTASSHAARVQLVEAFFLSSLRLRAPDVLVSAAVSWLKHQPGQPRIKDLTQYIGLSQSALERRFQQSVGISPKKFAMLVRLQRAVHLSKTAARMSTIAHSAGYFDQSHFTNDFQRMTGLSPDVYFHQNHLARL